MTSRNRTRNSGGSGRSRLIGLAATAAALLVALGSVLLLQGDDPGAEASLTAPGGATASRGISGATIPPEASAPAAGLAPPGPVATAGAPDLDALLAQAAAMEEVVVPPSGDHPGFTYRVPKPDEPEYEDYKAMLSHPDIARFAHEKPLYYDPEWRAQVDGRRRVPVHDLRFQDGAESLEQLFRFVALALAGNDRLALDRLRVNRDEYQLILWPEFPQSRPYMRVPPDEAWSFQVAKMRKGAERGIRDHGGKQLELATFSVGSAREYTNFRILETPLLEMTDADTGERLSLDLVAAVVECRGRYKVLMYND